MKLIKTVKVIEEGIGTSNMRNDGQYFESGYKLVVCPKCYSTVMIHYSFKNKEEAEYSEHYCPYCGKKIVKDK